MSFKLVLSTHLLGVNKIFIAVNMNIKWLSLHKEAGFYL